LDDGDDKAEADDLGERAGARSFESHVRLVGEDGKPLERPAAVTRSAGL